MAGEQVFRGSDGAPVEVTLLPIPNFSLSSFAALVEPLRLANYVAERPLYNWRVVTPEGAPVRSSCGVAVAADEPAERIRRPENIVVCGGVDGWAYEDQAALALLRRWARDGAYVGAACTGAYVLARAGLLRDRRCTIHWESLDGFAERFPDIDLRAALFEIDRDRFTCTGGEAACDMVLQDIAWRHGGDIMAAVAGQLLHDRVRSGRDERYLPHQAWLRTSHPVLVKALTAMAANREERLSLVEIAREANVSPRQLERLFRRYLDSTPARWYLRMRLTRARQLLIETQMPVTWIAVACGFGSTSHFSKNYRQFFGVCPREERRQRRAARDSAAAPPVSRAA